jgi:8-oxo-dGTP pyrophosphatase MutT (NUDIX family)
MPKTAKSKHSRAATSPPPQPPRRQVGALCWRRSGKGLRILLITSRDTSRWVIPKGWTMRNRTEPEAAAREAYEEAGLRGMISDRSLGVYTYLKALGAGRFVTCVVRVYPLEVREMLQVFPETGQRRTKWFEPEKAARRVDEHELAALIREFVPEPFVTDPAASET